MNSLHQVPEIKQHLLSKHHVRHVENTHRLLSKITAQHKNVRFLHSLESFIRKLQATEICKIKWPRLFSSSGILPNVSDMSREDFLKNSKFGCSIVQHFLTYFVIHTRASASFSVK